MLPSPSRTSIRIRAPTSRRTRRGIIRCTGVTGGTYNIDLKVKDQVIYQTGLKISSGTSPVFDINLKDIMEKDKGAAAEAEKRSGRGRKAVCRN